MNNHNIPVAAVVVAYYPDKKLIMRIRKVLEQVDELFIVNNGGCYECDGMREYVVDNGSITIIDRAENVGVAAALNAGVNAAVDKGYMWVVLFDQDSEPHTDMVREQLAVLDMANYGEGVAIVAPVIMDENSGNSSSWWLAKHECLPFFFRRKKCEDESAILVDVAITSGSLINADIYRDVGPFVNELFIDYVDIEYSLRVRRKGYKIIAACKAKLAHRLGEKKKVIRFGRCKEISCHSDIRHYYISRNRLYMYRKYALRFPHWFLYDIASMLISWVHILAFDPDALLKLKYYFRGLADGVLGKSGKYDVK